ncbi:hypothetical protein CR513_34365, partial [Mucuna pruriens]
MMKCMLNAEQILKKVFGCITYAHVLDQFQRKLDDKGEMCIFIGYNTNLKVYTLYHPETKKVEM